MMGLAHRILPEVSEQKFISFSFVLLRECSQNSLGISLLLHILVLKLTDVVVWEKGNIKRTAQEEALEMWTEFEIKFFISF